MSRDFDEGVRLRDLSGGDFEGAVDRSWWIDAGPNGGYLASLMLAGAQAVARPGSLPLSLTVHYLARPVEGRVCVSTTIERSGRTTTAISARLLQEDKTLALGLFTFSEPREGGTFHDLPMPQVAAAEDLEELPVPKELFPPFAQHFEYRFALGGLPYTRGDEAVIGGWIRPRVPRPVDALIIPTFADGFPPACFVRLDRPIGVPTIDLTVHFRAPLPPGDATTGAWTLARFESRWADHGTVEETGTMWSSEGILLAQSRQLALYRNGSSGLQGGSGG